MKRSVALYKQIIADAAARQQSRLRLPANLNDREIASLSDDLRRLTHLRRLDMSHTFVGDAGVRVVADALPELECLNVGATRITDQGAIHIAEHLPHLRELELWDTQITDRGLCAIAHNVGSIERLVLRGVKRITDNGVGTAALALSVLERLDLSHVAATDESARVLAGRTSLRSLGLRYTNVTDDGVELLCYSLPHLQSLDLWHTQITQSGLRRIVSAYRNGHLQSLEKIVLQETYVDLATEVLRSENIALIADSLTHPEDDYVAYRFDHADLCHIQQLVNQIRNL